MTVAGLPKMTLESERAGVLGDEEDGEVDQPVAFDRKKEEIYARFLI